LADQKAKSFAEILAQIEGFQSTVDVPWYRGCSKESYDLLPKVARSSAGPRKFADVQPRELRMFREFRERAKSLLVESEPNDWDVMFYMQHYGVPTRLLDWSESPFVALFFALKPRKGGYTEDPVVWMCDPEAWNSSLMPFSDDEDRVLDKNHRRMSDYAFGGDIERYRDEPLMLKGSYNSARIVAQRGSFTIFGKDFRPLQTISQENDKIPKDALKRILIDKLKAPEIFQSLIKKGITETFVYPDIEGLSLEVARKHGLSDD
jgi:hypothetical protein